MLEETARRDLFTAGALTLVNPVNIVGTSGKGLAKEFKKRFPRGDVFYRNACMDGSIEIGQPVVWHEGRLDVVYFPTKRHWRDPSRIEYVERGLAGLRRMAFLDAFRGPVAVPALGCGNGGLPYSDVRPLIRAYLDDLPVDVLLFRPLE